MSNIDDRLPLPLTRSPAQRGAGILARIAARRFRPRDKPEQLRLTERVRADLLLVVPPAQGASLARWLSCAAVVAEVSPGGVIVRAHANRVFRLADLARLVREWMQAHAVDGVLASCDGGLFSIAPPPSEAAR